MSETENAGVFAQLLAAKKRPKGKFKLNLKALFKSLYRIKRIRESAPGGDKFFILIDETAIAMMIVRTAMKWPKPPQRPTKKHWKELCVRWNKIPGNPELTITP